MSKKAIKVDLSTFFDDARKMAYIYVDPNWKTVECLQRRLEYLFDISSVWLLSDGCFLPSKESIDVIKHCDVIKAFILKTSQEVRKKKKSKKQKETSEESKSGETSLDENKAKVVNDELATSTRNQSIFPSPTSLEKEPDLCCSKDPENLSKKRKSENINSVEECDIVQQSFNANNSINPSKKRKSDGDIVMSTKRLPKIASSTLLNESNLREECDNTQQLPNPKEHTNPFRKCKSNKSHIYFDETGDISSPKSKKKNNSLTKADKKSSTIVVFRCPLNDVTNSDSVQPQKPRIFHLKSKNSTAAQLIEIQEDILLPPHSIKNTTDKSLSSNDATAVGNVENYTTEEEYFNSHTSSIIATISQNENAKEVSSANLNDEETNINGNTEDDTLTNKHVTESPCVNLLVKLGSETQNKSPKKISATHIVGNNSESQNKSLLEHTFADNNHTDSQMELSYVEDQASEINDKTESSQKSKNENSVLSIDCVDPSIDLESEVHLENDVKDQSSIDLEVEVPLDDNIEEQCSIDLEDDVPLLDHVNNECDKFSESDVEEISEVIELNESEYNGNTTLNNSKEESVSSEQITVHNILPLSKDMTHLPSANDIIIFKIPYTKNKKHTSTDFVAGRVEYVNKRTKNIKVAILDGISELCHVPSNFICNLDDSNDGVNTHLQLKFSDIIEPKLFEM